MYLLFGIFLFICALFICIGFFRKRCIIRKVCQMDICRKVCLLNEILEPFGFCYEEKQDIIMTNVDAWQRKFGYRTLFDRTASCFGMVFDCEPIFFYYRECTYRLELWKGQYGINTGCEVGIYRAPGILKPEQFDKAVFESVSDKEMLAIGMKLCHKGQKLFENTRYHWWNAGFCLGSYCEPENLTMQVSITFMNTEVMICFVESLLNMGYQKCDIEICDLTVCFVFCCPHSRQPRCRRCLRIRWQQWKNRFFCKLFLWITRCFTCTLDRILYLYFFLPAAFRHMFLCRRSRRQRFHRRKKKVRLRGI